MSLLIHAVAPTDDPEISDASFAALGVAEAWYQYLIGDYEGSGHLIFRTADGLWCHNDLGHCSCYGPEDNLNAKDGETTLDLLLARCTQELAKQLAPLVAAIRA